MARKLIITQTGRIVVADSNTYLSCGPGVWTTPKPKPGEQEDKEKTKRLIVRIMLRNGVLTTSLVTDPLVMLANRRVRRRLIFDRLKEMNRKEMRHG